MQRTLGTAAVLLAVTGLVARAQVPATVTVTVRPDTVTVGQPFVIAVEVLAPAGVTISFPNGPDSSSEVQSLDPVAVAGRGSRQVVDRTATYRVAAWNVGRVPIVLPGVRLVANGRPDTLGVGTPTIFVKSVLPADSARRVPRPARALFVAWPIPWWILGVLAFIALLLWLAWYRRRSAASAVPTVPPFERAQREFARVAAFGLVEAGERGRHVALMVEVVRDYLAARFPLASLSLTNGELLAELRDAPTVPAERLARLLEEADLIKFARGPISLEESVALGEEARGVVADEHTAANPPSPAGEPPAEAA